MRNVAIFGGSFNPVHNGHIALVQRMKDAFSLDEVIVIPTFETPLKDNTPMVSSSHRFNMLTLAFTDIDFITISDIEIMRQGKSYTVDTLGELSKVYSNDKLHFIVGADAFVQLPQWRSPEEIFKLAKVLTIARDALDFEILQSKAEEYKLKYNAECGILNEPVSDISSTKVRKLIAEGKSTKGFLPTVVADYIKEQGFYG